MVRKAALIAACLGLASSAQAGESKQLKRLISMTPQDYAASTRVKDDSLETVVSFDTEAGFKEKSGLLGLVGSDVFLRAFKDKVTGKITFQVYATLKFRANTWPSFNQVNFETPEGLQSKELRKLGSDVDCSTHSIFGQCTYREDVAYEVDEALLRSIANLYKPGGRSAFKMRFKGSGGTDSDMAILPAEAAGLFIAIGNYGVQTK